MSDHGGNNEGHDYSASDGNNNNNNNNDNRYDENGAHHDESGGRDHYDDKIEHRGGDRGGDRGDRGDRGGDRGDRGGDRGYRGDRGGYDRERRGGDDRRGGFRGGDRDRPSRPRSKPGCTIYVSAKEIGQEGGIDEQILKDAFSGFGNIENMFVARNPQGFAFISFDNEDSANKAINDMNEREIQGCVIRVELKREKRDGEVRAGDWACPKCNTNNFARRDQCFKCFADRPRGFRQGGGGRGGHRRGRSGDRRNQRRSRSRQRR